MTRNMANKVVVATCPACDTRIRFRKHPRRGQFVTCPECESVLEVVHVSPLELDWADEAFDDDEIFDRMHSHSYRSYDEYEDLEDEEDWD
ncbi:MAG: hypothetical protein D6706_12645 [Chloroflexi bacterium]|nr:MAG: hypothetical protein D6706_12645 [Chloroflexota bacterium]